MQKTNHYYRTFTARSNAFKIALLGVISYYAGIPRIIMEVFLRKGFGVRHFSMTTALFVALFLMFVPMKAGMISFGGGGEHWLKIINFLTWYSFVGCFIWKSWQHHKEVMKEKKAGFSYDKISSYDGDIDPRLWNLKIKNELVKPRLIECVLEPAIFFFSGLILMLCGQMVGTLFVVCSLIYGLSYYAAYYAGDLMIYDYIDNLIYNAQIEKSFMNNLHPAETQGVQFRGNRPEDFVTRQEIYNGVFVHRQTFTAQ